MGALIESLKDSGADVRAQAANVLGRFSQKDAVRALEQCLEDPESLVRGSAVRALGKIKDSTSIPALAQAFENADESYRDDIAQALAAMKQDDVLALTDLLMGLRSAEARAGVAWALGLKRDQRPCACWKRSSRTMTLSCARARHARWANSPPLR